MVIHPLGSLALALSCQTPHKTGSYSTVFYTVLGQSGFVFAMAKIHRIGHDHQAPFWLVVLYCIVVVLGYQAVT